MSQDLDQLFYLQGHKLRAPPSVVVLNDLVSWVEQKHCRVAEYITSIKIDDQEIIHTLTDVSGLKIRSNAKSSVYITTSNFQKIIFELLQSLSSFSEAFIKKVPSLTVKIWNEDQYRRSKDLNSYFMDIELIIDLSDKIIVLLNFNEDLCTPLMSLNKLLRKINNQLAKINRHHYTKMTQFLIVKLMPIVRLYRKESEILCEKLLKEI